MAIQFQNIISSRALAPQAKQNNQTRTQTFSKQQFDAVSFGNKSNDNAKSSILKNTALATAFVTALTALSGMGNALACDKTLYRCGGNSDLNAPIKNKIPEWVYGSRKESVKKEQCTVKSAYVLSCTQKDGSTVEMDFKNLKQTITSSDGKHIIEMKL